MNTECKFYTANEFYKNASKEGKAYRLEAFSFTFQMGLNIMFNDMDDLNDIIKDTEIEFWQVEDNLLDTYINVNNFDELELVLEWLNDSVEQSLIDAYVAIKEEGYVSKLSEAQDWHEDNYYSENMSDEEFGEYIIEAGGDTIPEWLQGYIDYERFGRDAKFDYVTIGNNIYSNR